MLFPITEIVAVRSSSVDVIYEAEAGKDYRFRTGTHEIIVPRESRIVTTSSADLRRPANSQRHQLTHRDGNGEILFGAKLEYHQLQTSVTHKKSDSTWPAKLPIFVAAWLPITLRKLRYRDELSVALLGDSISTGCNASAWGGGVPFPPAYQDLLVQHLADNFMHNSSVDVGQSEIATGVAVS